MAHGARGCRNRCDRDWRRARCAVGRAEPSSSRLTVLTHMSVTLCRRYSAEYSRAKSSSDVQTAPTIHEFINCDSRELRANRACSDGLLAVVVDRRHAHAGFDDAPTIERHRRGVRDRVFCIYVRYELAARGSADSLR